jgi:hypothetical protein
VACNNILSWQQHTSHTLTISSQEEWRRLPTSSVIRELSVQQTYLSRSSLLINLTLKIKIILKLSIKSLSMKEAIWLKPWITQESPKIKLESVSTTKNITPSDMMLITKLYISKKFNIYYLGRWRSIYCQNETILCDWNFQYSHKDAKWSASKSWRA